MYAISADYKDYIENNLSISPKSKIVVDGVEYTGSVIKSSPKFSHKNTSMIGGFPIKSCSFEIYDLDNSLDFENKELTVYKGININDTVEYIPQGIFIPRAKDIKTNISQKTISFENIQDKGQLFDGIYQSSLDWTTQHTGLEIVQEICRNLGIILETIDFNWADYEFKQPNFESNTTYREVVSRLAEIGGSIAFMSRTGGLVIKGQTLIRHTISNKRYTKLSKEKTFGSINTVVLGKDGKNDDIVYPNSIDIDRIEWKILDNPFVDLYRQEMIETVANYIIGQSIIPFELTDFVDGFYLDLNDAVEVVDKNNNSFTAVILNYESTSRIKSKISAETQTTSLTDYNLAGSNTKSLTKIRHDVDHINEQIVSTIQKTETIEDNINNNYYDKTTVSELLQTAETGITNTFSEAGGNNVFRNTGLWFEENGIYEYWEGTVKRQTNDNSANHNSMLLQNGSLIQEQEVSNGNYSISFYYQKLNELATASVVINDVEYPLDSLSVKQFYTGEKDSETNEYITQPIVVNTGHLKIEFKCDTNNAVEIYDLMANKGTVKLAYSQNENETTTDTVNISKGITITSSNIDVIFKANADGIRIYTMSGTIKTYFTDKGLTTKEAIIEDEAQIVKTLWQEVEGQTWITRM